MASTDLAKLVVKLEAQTAQYQKGFEQAQKQLDKFKKNTEGSLQSVQRSFATFNRALGTLGVGLGAVALTTAAKAAIEFGDSIDKAAAKTGIGVESFQKLAYAAKQNDLDLNALGTAFKKLQVTISEAGSGSKAALETFKALGIEFNALRALKPEEQFELIAEKISKLKDPADRVRAAVELFGKAGADLLPMFEDGAAGLRKLNDEFERMGGALSEEQIKNLAAADDAIKRLSGSFSRLAAVLTAQIAPGLAQFFDNITALVTGDAVGKLREQIDFLQRMQGRSFVAINYGEIGTGFFTAAEGAEALYQAEKKLYDLQHQNVAPLGSAARTAAMSRGGTPGYQTQPTAVVGKKPSTDEWLQAMGLGDIPITVAEITTSAMDQMYADMNKATQTAAERALADWAEFEAQVNELLAQGKITADQAAARLLEHDEIKITAEKIFPKEEEAKLSEFMQRASENVQDIIARNLEDGFKDGIKGILQAFAQMLSQMAAQEVAAQIGEKIFGTGGVGSGGGWVGTALSFASSFFGPMSGLGDIPITAKYLPAGGGRAAGGPVSPGYRYMVGDQGRAEWFVPQMKGRIESDRASEGGVMVNQRFTIEAPNGTVSRATQQQIASAAARGLAAAGRRT